MIKRLYLFVLASIIVVVAKSQISIMMSPLNPFTVKVSDAFNVSVSNAGASLKVYYVCNITAQNGRQLVTAKTSPVDLPSGITQLNERALAPVYQYTDASLQTGNLPIGKYRLCLKVFSANDNEELAQECAEAEVISLSPPLLVSPENESEVTVDYPLLVWLAPTPVNAKSGITYDLKLVEVYPGQTGYDAVHRNRALLQKEGIKNTSLQYPANAGALELNKTYAWKVVARSSDGLVIGETEVWTFVRKPESDTHPEGQPVKDYIRLKTEKTQDYVLVKEQMKLIYEERYADVEATISIKNADGKELYTEKLKVQRGENRFVIDLEEVKGLKGNSYYYLEMSAPERMTQYLMFKNLK